MDEKPRPSDPPENSTLADAIEHNIRTLARLHVQARKERRKSSASRRTPTSISPSWKMETRSEDVLAEIKRVEEYVRSRPESDEPRAEQ